MKFHRFLSLLPFRRRTKKISPYHLQEQLAHPHTPLLLDVRTPEEYEHEHIAGALLIPVAELEQRLVELQPYREQSIITV